MVDPQNPHFSIRRADQPNSKASPASPEQLRLVRQFVSRVGGLENARRALAMLAVLKRAS